MAEVLRLREAARLIGVSPGRLYRAIADGRLTAAPGGGPGKPTLVSLEAVQAFCRSEGLRVPDGSEPRARSERVERAERSTSPMITRSPCRPSRQ
jgi:excisionase family DNA binding protein